MKRLTHKQADVLRFLATYIEANDRAPSVREICAAFGFKSTTAARGHLLALETRGCLTRIVYHPRGIDLTEAAKAFVARTSGKAAA